MTFFTAIITWLLSLWGRSPVVPVGGPIQRLPPDIQPTTGRALITRPERVGARFHDTGSEAWRKQFEGTPMEGQHGGTDFLAPEGSAVYAPYAMRVIAVGYYPAGGRMGYYVIGSLADGVEYYSGHLAAQEVASNTNVEAGAIIGHTNEYAHTHIQMKRGGVLIDPETYLASH